MPRNRTHRLGYTASTASGLVRTHGGVTTITRDGKPFLRIDLAAGEVACWPDGPDSAPATIATFLPGFWTGSDYRPATATDGDCDRCHKPFGLTDDVVEMIPGDPRASCRVHQHCWTALLATRPTASREPVHIQPHVEVLTAVDVDGNPETAVVVDGRRADDPTCVTVNPDYGDRRLLSEWRAEAESIAATVSPVFGDLVRAAYAGAEPHCTVNNFNTAVSPQPGVTDLNDLDPRAWVARGVTLHTRLTHPWHYDVVLHDVNAARRTDNTVRAAWALHAVKAVSTVLREARETRPDRIPTDDDWCTAADVAHDTYSSVTTEPAHTVHRAAVLQHLIEATCHLSDALGYGQDDAVVIDPVTTPTSWYGINNLFNALRIAVEGPWKADLTDAHGTVGHDDLLDAAQAEYKGNIDLYPGPHDH